MSLSDWVYALSIQGPPGKLQGDFLIRSWGSEQTKQRDELLVHAQATNSCPFNPKKRAGVMAKLGV
jgi:hypothetical protein